MDAPDAAWDQGGVTVRRGWARFLLVWLCLMLATAVMPAPGIAASEGTITVGTTEPLQLLDPALTVFLNDYATFHINVYDTLVYRDKQGCSP